MKGRDSGSKIFSDKLTMKPLEGLCKGKGAVEYWGLP
jgi:hypothetical protein